MHSYLYGRIGSRENPQQQGEKLMKKKTTVSGEVFKFFTGVGKEVSKQVVGRSNKKRINKKGTGAIHIHYHFNKGKNK